MKGTVVGDVALVMDADDAVATALDDLAAGTTLPPTERTPVESPIECREDVPFGHKIALRRLDAGDEIRKYGEVIGRATVAIEPGEWVHTHNCESTRGRGDLAAAGGEHA
ncbi:UxaA family hydrolase [Haloplanus aerogenes]|uniref:Altronate dehydratase small subunit n=1 Tax=Haloplanus aerogenes TaxID=660522 RepID=A0A3M0DXW1_9EURY|nr:UxaA family hydrolase [Haloplanus aerogenes]AZH24273.1 altronate hydrolase [Haloplanus aerogenes]RMB24096.1 altronate dehydratase small subunit [Haloplanus aerogenes]